MKTWADLPPNPYLDYVHPAMWPVLMAKILGGLVRQMDDRTNGNFFRIEMGNPMCLHTKDGRYFYAPKRWRMYSYYQPPEGLVEFYVHRHVAGLVHRTGVNPAVFHPFRDSEEMLRIIVQLHREAGYI